MSTPLHEPHLTALLLASDPPGAERSTPVVVDRWTIVIEPLLSEQPVRSAQASEIEATDAATRVAACGDDMA